MVLALLSAIVSGGLAMAASASALPLKAGAAPQPYLYCASTVPSSNEAYSFSYAGITARPSYNSTRTTCLDRAVTQSFPVGLTFYGARPIDWNKACSMYWGKGWYAREVAGAMYCYR